MFQWGAILLDPFCNPVVASRLAVASGGPGELANAANFAHWDLFCSGQVDGGRTSE